MVPWPQQWLADSSHCCLLSRGKTPFLRGGLRERSPVLSSWPYPPLLSCNAHWGQGKSRWACVRLSGYTTGHQLGIPTLELCWVCMGQVFTQKESIVFTFLKRVKRSWCHRSRQTSTGLPNKTSQPALLHPFIPALHTQSSPSCVLWLIKEGEPSFQVSSRTPPFQTSVF